MKLLSAIACLVIGVLFFISLGLWLENRSLKAKVPTFREFQQKLVDRGHKIKVDGKMCKAWNVPGHSETLEAWDREIGNQFAPVYFTVSGRPKK